MELILDIKKTTSKKTCTHKVRKRIHRTALQKLFFPSKKRYACQHCKKTFLD